MQQFRVESATAFRCFRCREDKRSKLLTIYLGNWNHILCNGCYGGLLSIYDIKASTEPEPIKAEKLSEVLLSLVTEDQMRRSAEKIRISESRVAFLAPQTVRFLSTADYVAQSLSNSPSLDWSAAVIGLCKAVEFEIVQRFVEPLKAIASSRDLAADTRDNDLARVAKYCAGRTSNPPELGSINHFLQTAANSRNRMQNSLLLQSLRELFSKWPDSAWLISSNGATLVLPQLATRFRNRAAHTDELSKQDYEACYEMVAGPGGMLWHLVSATTVKK